MKLLKTFIGMSLIYLLILSLTGQEIGMNQLISNGVDQIGIQFGTQIIELGKLITSLECMMVFTVFTTIYLYMKKQEKNLTYFLIFVIISGVSMYFLKDYYIEGHPEFATMIPFAGISYLSMDTLFGTIFYGMLFLTFYQMGSIEKKISYLFPVLIVLIGIFHLLIKTSYFTDLLLGYTIGCGVLYLFLELPLLMTKVSHQNHGVK